MTCKGSATMLVNDEIAPFPYLKLLTTVPCVSNFTFHVVIFFTFTWKVESHNKKTAAHSISCLHKLFAEREREGGERANYSHITICFQNKSFQKIVKDAKFNQGNTTTEATFQKQ